MIFLTSFYCLLSVYFQKQRDDFQNGKKEITYQKNKAFFGAPGRSIRMTAKMNAPKKIILNTVIPK